MPIIGVIASSMKGAPGIPTIGTATDVGTARAYNNGAATVTFTAAPGATATSFTATSSPGGFTATGASSPLTVTGLQSSVSYTFTVTATNASGTSAASAASNSITATTVPQAPTIGTAADGGTGTTATVTYTAGATGGKTVSAYTATSSPGSFTGSGTSPITVGGLTAGTAYTFTVTATNANGTSIASAASNSVTPVNPTDMVLLARLTVSGATGSTPVYMTISGIPQTSKHAMIVVNTITNSESNLGPIMIPTSSVGDDYGLAGFTANVGSSGTSPNFQTGNVTANYYYYFNTNVTGGVGGSANLNPRANHFTIMPNYNDTNISRSGIIFGGAGNVNLTTNRAKAINQTVNDTRSSNNAMSDVNWGEYSGGPSPTNPFRNGSTMSIYGVN
jgi:hypothetical protein